jgi:UDP-N-acetylglucosamine acyltransferase
MIHETAIVDAKTNISGNVSIGPYSVIGADVEIGKNTSIGSHVVINGPCKIGEDNKILQFNSIGEAPQHAHYKGETTCLEIGNRNVFREFCTINRGTTDGGGLTKIGDDNLFMAYVHIAHDCFIGNKTIFANNASLAGHVIVGDHAIFGGFSGIHQFCKVGAHVMTGIATISLKDIPPFLLVSGNTAKPYGLNVRGLKKRGFSEKTIKALRAAYKKIYRSKKNTAAAVSELAELAREFPEVQYFIDFISDSERGIIR